MNSNRYYSRVKRIQETFSPETASKYIEGGWELLSVRDYTRRELVGSLPVLETRPIYVLGYLRERERD